MENETCGNVAYQAMSVCAPITVTPFVQTGPTTTNCCGTMIVTEDATTCDGVLNGSCRFTVRQTICVEIPVEFGATAVAGSPSSSCGSASSLNICTDCGSAASNADTINTTNTILTKTTSTNGSNTTTNGNQDTFIFE